MRTLFAFFMLLCLAGCAGDQANRQSVHFSDPTQIAIPPAEVVHIPPVTREELRSESLNSQNALSQGFSGIGAQLGKIGDRVDASLAKFETNLTTTVKTEANASATAVAQLTAQFQTKIEMLTTLAVQLKLSLDAMAQAQAQAQIGFNNRIDAVQSTVKAGRDSYQTQYTKEMRDTLVDGNRTELALVLVMALLIVLLQERSRRRADLRHQQLYDHFVKPDAHCERQRETIVIRFPPFQGGQK